VKTRGPAPRTAARLTTTRGFRLNRILESGNSRASGTGGIAYHYVSDTYIALFSKFIPVGVWEAVHIIQGLLDQQSKVRPDTIHADTQGQALPVYALAHLCGFERMPRVRNWKDLNFYRPTPTARFRVHSRVGERDGRGYATTGGSQGCPSRARPTLPAEPPTLKCQKSQPPDLIFKWTSSPRLQAAHKLSERQQFRGRRQPFLIGELPRERDRLSQPSTSLLVGIPDRSGR